MTAAEYQTFSQAVKDAPQPKPESAIAAFDLIERSAPLPVKENILLPQPTHKPPLSGEVAQSAGGVLESIPEGAWQSPKDTLSLRADEVGVAIPPIIPPQ